MDPTADQAMRTVLDHGAGSVMQQLQADNERLRNELAQVKANLSNRYLRSVLNLIDKHKDLGYGSLEVSDERLVLYGHRHRDIDVEEMLEQLSRFPRDDKLAVIPVLCELGYWVMLQSNIDRIDSGCPFAIHWNHDEEKIHRVYYDFFARGGVLHRPTNVN